MKSFNSKKILVILLILVSFIFFVMQGFADKPKTKMFFDGTEISLNVPPILMNNTTMIPLKPILEHIGAHYYWDIKIKKLTIVSANNTVILYIGKSIATINKDDKLLDVPPTIMKDYTYISAQCAAECFGVKVIWNKYANVVSVLSNSIKPTPTPTPIIRNGFNSYKWKNGIAYNGNWIENTISGSGKIYYNNGDVYEGSFFNGLKQGVGTYTWANKEVYTGDWEKDKMSGYGKYKFLDGDIYQGSWENNMMNGSGKYTFNNGQILNGVWQDNQYSSED